MQPAVPAVPTESPDFHKLVNKIIGSIGLGLYH
jgi:hypothetical protein